VAVEIQLIVKRRLAANKGSLEEKVVGQFVRALEKLELEQSVLE